MHLGKAKIIADQICWMWSFGQQTNCFYQRAVIPQSWLMVEG